MHDPIATRPEELARADAWWQAHLGGEDAALPISFTLDGTTLAGLLPGWAVSRETHSLDDRREALTITAAEPRHGLELRVQAVRYRDFPAVEWTAYLRQGGNSVSPLLADVQGLDLRIEDERHLLRSVKGDTCASDLYEPWELPLRPGSTHTFAPVGGRGSNHVFPFFVLEGATGSIFLAVGWPGQWQATFTRDAAHGLQVRAGQEQMRFRLNPGEEVRTPLIALLFTAGADRVRAQNLWRRWMLAHNVPRPGGELPKPMLQVSTALTTDEMTKATEEDQIACIEFCAAQDLPVTHLWMDAGWYPCHVPEAGKNHWGRTGTWEPDAARFPRGLRPIADRAHALEMGTIVWFEPERVSPGTWLHDTHPEWLIARLGQEVQPAGIEPTTRDLWWAARHLDLGNPEALAWLTQHIGDAIAREGIDVYRQDYNWDPLPFWRDNDAPVRAGLHENRHVAGYLAFWDGLRARFPGMLIDSCASGGRRNDLETMRRAVPLHPTDYSYADLPVKQALRHSLFGWFPYFGGPVLPTDRVDPYAFRSTMGLSTCITYDLRQPHDLDLLRRLMRESHTVAPCFYGDYYPLTPYSRGDDTWMAWQFHRPAQQDGVVQIFRRSKSPYETARFTWQALEPDSMYELTDFDEPDGTSICAGAALLEGWEVAMPERPAAKTIYYRRIAAGESS